MTEHEIPERLARFSALLAERGIDWEYDGVWNAIIAHDDRSFAKSVTVDAAGDWRVHDEVLVGADSPITTAIALIREVWHE